MDSPNKIKGILFDFDGVLVKSMEDHFKSWKVAMKDFGVDLKEEEYFPLEGMNMYEIAKKFCWENKLEESHHLEIVKKKEEHYLQNHTFEFYEGVEEFINFLKTQKILIGIVTGGQYARLIKTVPESFLNKFNAVVTGDKTQKGKPFPDPYLKGLKELNLKPEECIVVENAPLGIKSAKNAGIYCVAITSTVEKSKLIEADEIIDAFKTLKTSSKIFSI